MLCESCVFQFSGIGSVIRGLTIMYAMNNLIVYIQLLVCSFITLPFAVGYRVGQAIALMIAIDRFVAVWKPLSYSKFQNSVSDKIIGNIHV